MILPILEKGAEWRRLHGRVAQQAQPSSAGYLLYRRFPNRQTVKKSNGSQVWKPAIRQTRQSALRQPDLGNTPVSRRTFGGCYERSARTHVRGYLLEQALSAFPLGGNERLRILSPGFPARRWHARNGEDRLGMTFANQLKIAEPHFGFAESVLHHFVVGAEAEQQVIRLEAEILKASFGQAFFLFASAVHRAACE